MCVSVYVYLLGKTYLVRLGFTNKQQQQQGTLRIFLRKKQQLPLLPVNCDDCYIRPSKYSTFLFSSENTCFLPVVFIPEENERERKMNESQRRKRPIVDHFLQPVFVAQEKEMK